MPEASYPHDLLYHAENGWAHVQSDHATFGITWFAQDSLQEVVFRPTHVGRRCGEGSDVCTRK